MFCTLLLDHSKVKSLSWCIVDFGEGSRVTSKLKPLLGTKTAYNACVKTRRQECAKHGIYKHLLQTCSCYKPEQCFLRASTQGMASISKSSSKSQSRALQVLITIISTQQQEQPPTDLPQDKQQSHPIQRVNPKLCPQRSQCTVVTFGITSQKQINTTTFTKILPTQRCII